MFIRGFKNMKVIFETERLLVREYAEEDADAFFKLNATVAAAL